ncbi:MAG: tripartite tricarboxylate transporter substrate-binding protein [Burkholderiaceae bacterium]|nr:tripartite tricarboxylate transporter substrate-binding protein [Burkholderiaceae bacterium]
MKLDRRNLLLASTLAVAAPTLWAQSQDKPVIRILMGLPPGGGTDSIARYIADKLREQLGQPVIIESRIGVGGRLAADALMNAAPDGLTYMIAPNATPTFQTLVFGPQLKWNIWRDFAPVAGLVSYPLGMATSLNTGATNVREFVQWVKANPQKASFGTPGMGGQNHFLGLQFAKIAGIDLPVTPYKGTPPLITDLLGGHVPAAVTLMDELLKHKNSGKLRVLGIFSDKRSELMPDIPTFAEQGYNVSSGDGWTAMWAPAKTPPAEIARMQQALQKILANPQVKDYLMTRLAVMPHYRNAQEMAKAQRDELATWEPIVKASGFKPE